MLGKSYRLADIAGIRVQVHWSFFLLVGWVLISTFMTGAGILNAVLQTTFLLVLFGCVVLHEFGHAFAARLFRIPTRDITLLPIGGVARLERMPRKPWQEIVVALAGPAVNVVIVAVLWLLAGSSVRTDNWMAVAIGEGGFWQRVMFVNVMLIVFNMLPAFPMDGGRVLRGSLAIFVEYAQATRIAAIVGQTCAVGFAILGLYGNPMLLLLAAFIYISAAAESRQVQVQSRLRGWRVSDAINRNFEVVSLNDSAALTAMRLLHHPQRAFPIIDGGHLVGIVDRAQIMRAVELPVGTTVGQLPRRSAGTVQLFESLENAVQRGAANGHDLMVVTMNGELAGLLDLTTVAEVIAARSKFRDGSTRPMPGVTSWQTGSSHA